MLMPPPPPTFEPDPKNRCTHLNHSVKWLDHHIVINNTPPFQELHEKYGSLVEEVKSMQAKCMKGIDHQRYRFKALTEVINK